MRTKDIARERRHPRAATSPTASRSQGVNFHRDRKAAMHQSGVAPRAEPSTHGANQWTSGRRNKRKHR
jgi:hypothetical protein